MLDDALVVPSFRVSDFVTRHAQGPQESDSDNDDESDEDDDEEDENDVYSDHGTTAPVPPPRPRESAILAAARRRWAVPPGFTPKPTCSAPTNPTTPEEARLSAKKLKKKKLHRKSRSVKREELRQRPGLPLAPKAVSLMRRRQTSPFSADFCMQSHPLPVASSGWMGLRDPPPLDLEPEYREYTFEEAQALPGMTVLDWHGCVSFSIIHTLCTTDLAFAGRKPAPIVDADRHVIGLFAGIPRDDDWHANVTGPAAALMEEAAEGIYDRVFSGVYYGTRKQEKRRRSGRPTPLEQKIPRRGGHRSKTAGNSMGGGQETPSPFFHAILTTVVLTGLLAQKPFQRIAGFTNGKNSSLSALFKAHPIISHVSMLCARSSRTLSQHSGSPPSMEQKPQAQFSLYCLGIRRRDL